MIGITNTWRQLASLFGTSHQRLDPLSIRLQEPPSPPDGHEIHPPEFVGIGAQKCGTSWWHGLILKHPQVYDSSSLSGKVSPPFLRKERHFFDRYFNQPFTERDVAEYARWFARPKGMIAGEWTPRYLVEHWAPTHVRTAAPDSRILVMVRDPVDRFVSGMRHQARDKSPLDGSDAHIHFLRGLYHQQLSTWLCVFPRSQLLVLQYEKCVLEPESELRRTFEFLGLPMPPVSSTDVETRRNATWNKEAYALHDTHRQSLVDAYRGDVSDLLHEFPEIDGRLWKHF